MNSKYEAENRFIDLTLNNEIRPIVDDVPDEVALAAAMASKEVTESFIPMYEAEMWYDEIPKECALCHVPLKGQKFFVDGKTRMGPWAIMCPRCFNDYGVGLGRGAGTKYDVKSGKVMS
jgi:hypothetical protein